MKTKTANKIIGMRKLSNYELRSMTEGGRTVFNETLDYEIAQCSLELRKLDNQADDSDVLDKPDKICIANKDIIFSLKSDFGIKIKTVRELNVILEEMGLVSKGYKGYSQTAAGMKYSIFNRCISPANIWTDDIIPVIAEYITGKET